MLFFKNFFEGILVNILPKDKRINRRGSFKEYFWRTIGGYFSKGQTKQSAWISHTIYLKDY